MYSPHLDLHQRLTLLDALEAAAHELAADPRVAPRLAGGTGHVAGPPRLERPAAGHGHVAGPKRIGAGAADGAAGGKGVGREGEQGGGEEGGEGRRGPRTRVFGPVALRKRKEAEERARTEGGDAGAGGRRAYRNRFADVALRWAAGLLREVRGAAVIFRRPLQSFCLW